jgi:cytochrome c oxidase subunit II
LNDAGRWMVGAQPEGGALDPQGPVSGAMADLFWLMVGLGGAVVVAVVVVLALGLLRRRPAGEPEPDRERPNRFGRWFVVGGVAVPLVILLIVFGATVQAMRSVPTTAPSDALVIEVVGHQFWWEVRYPTHGVTVRDELHLPVGRPVNLQLSSADVIHSFWVPELAGKIDMLPDYTNTLVLEADRPGVHLNRCAEFCGLEHTKMVMTVVAEPEEQFAAWLAERRG